MKSLIAPLSGEARQRGYLHLHQSRALITVGRTIPGIHSRIVSPHMTEEFLLAGTGQHAADLAGRDLLHGAELRGDPLEMRRLFQGKSGDAAMESAQTATP